MHPLVSTAHLHNEQLFSELKIDNPQFKQVILFTSERTGIPVDKVLSDSVKDDVVYARHLMHYYLNQILGFSPLDIHKNIGSNRSSVYNSVNNLRKGWKKLQRVKNDILAGEQALRS